MEKLSKEKKERRKLVSEKLFGSITAIDEWENWVEKEGKKNKKIKIKKDDWL